MLKDMRRAARVVAQISNLLYRRFPTCAPPDVAKRLECGVFPRFRRAWVGRKRGNTPHSKRFARFGCGFAAFSLIEMLLVIAILLLLTTLYWMPHKSDRQKQLKAACQKNLEKVYLALEVYANDHAGKFPDVPGARTSEEALDGLVPRYTSDTAVFICPASKDAPLPSGESFLKRKISYSYYMGRYSTNGNVLVSDAQADALAKAPGQNA